jgi:hypothetical protein
VAGVRELLEKWFTHLLSPGVLRLGGTAAPRSKSLYRKLAPLGGHKCLPRDKKKVTEGG